ncbi:MAG: hypothetical protein EXQ70_11940 [Solirubrobacterales bacterium]|nr:hypothetical protein [Solirubrobacterales bacterium]
MVRARTKGDIEALRAQIPGLEPVENAGADYRWRAFITREQWRDAVTELIEAIDYDNFKTAVGERQGQERANTYHHVWGELMSLQREDGPDGA